MYASLFFFEVVSCGAYTTGEQRYCLINKNLFSKIVLRERSWIIFLFEYDSTKSQRHAESLNVRNTNLTLSAFFFLLCKKKSFLPTVQSILTYKHIVFPKLVTFAFKGRDPL